MTVADAVRHWRDESNAVRFRDIAVWQDKNIPELVDQRSQERPDKLVLVDDRVRWTYLVAAFAVGRRWQSSVWPTLYTCCAPGSSL